MKVKLSEVKPLTDEQLDSLNRSDLLVVARNYNRIRLFLEGYVNELEEKFLEIEGKLFRIQAKLFSPSSEKSPRSGNSDNKKRDPKPRSSTTKLPSERYPDAEVIEKHVTYVEEPECSCCGNVMSDSGMVETSEFLTTIPQKFIIVRQHRHKYRCHKCHGDIVTAPAIPRVIPGSSYSDELIVDVTMSKFCDLIPIERYCQMASRQGFEGLPPHSLIGTTLKLADFLKPIYERLKQETLNTPVLLADETPHRMLEGDKKSSWYLWGFLSSKSCFYECHDTRSGDVASAVLKNSICEVLLTDVYAGYRKAVRETNEIRLIKGLLPILMAYCNSHARRLFVSSKGEGPAETQFMVDQYKEIYKLESSTKNQPYDKVLEIRQQMSSMFEKMKSQANTMLDKFSSKSGIYAAFNYFLKNYNELTLFISNPLIPIDNNASERLLRSPVVGRKTWYGTHSIDGAEAAAIHFSLIQACKLNSINPRIYYSEIIKRLYSKNPVITPKEFSVLQHRMNNLLDDS